jgi:large subunit ribosomal protein L16
MSILKKSQLKKRPHLLIPKGVRFSGQENSYVLRSCAFGALSLSEIEAARRVIRRNLKKKGELFVRAFAFLPLMKKPAEVRMGKGKGNRLRKNVYPIRPGQVIFEIKNVELGVALNALHVASAKISVKAKVYAYIKTNG